MTTNKSKTIPDVQSLIDQLLSTPSISCTNQTIDQGNQNVIHLLANWFESLNFQCEIQALEHHQEKANLIATLGTGSNGLVLAGHTDTVPLDEALWHVNPFKATEKDDRLYGLGSCDMKSFFAVVIEALKDLDLSKIRRPLIILATADEETSMSGAKAIAKNAGTLGLNNAR
jgi:acetylornithine deacetylase